MKALGGAGDVLLLGYREEDAQLIKGHPAHLIDFTAQNQQNVLLDC